jgi:hypothetical protein
VSTSQFHLFAIALSKRFAEMSKHELFVVDIDGQQVWESYLAAFPEGTNPIYRVRTEHDGSYDRNVIRKIGNVVAIDSRGNYMTVWDLKDLPEPYNVVAAQLSDQINQATITSLFRWKEAKLGYVSDDRRSRRRQDPQVVPFPRRYRAQALRAASPAEKKGAAEQSVQVYRRGLEELTPLALETTLDLMEQGVLYKGDEFKKNVKLFYGSQVVYRNADTERDRALMLWIDYDKPYARVRNTAIGQLLQDLSEGWRPSRRSSATRRWSLRPTISARRRWSRRA